MLKSEVITYINSIKMYKRRHNEKNCGTKFQYKKSKLPGQYRYASERFHEEEKVFMIGGYDHKIIKPTQSNKKTNA